MKRVIIACTRLDLPGGVERTVTQLANLLESKGHFVVILICDVTTKSFFQINARVKIHHVNTTFGIRPTGNFVTRKIELFWALISMRKAINIFRPDIIISTEYPITISLRFLTWKRSCKIFSWEHHHHSWLEKNRFWKTLHLFTNRRIDGIIALTNVEAAFYSQFTKSFVIHNFIDIKENSISFKNENIIITVGQLIPRKGMDLFMQIAGHILQINKNWKWILIGAGTMHESILEFIAKNNLEGQLLIQAPRSSNLSAQYSTASIFALTSRMEALPMVLIEAMAYGLPCISFDCPEGPAEIINNEIDGYLIPCFNTDLYCQKIQSLIDDHELRKKFSHAAHENSKRFTPEKIYPLWERILEGQLDPLNHPT